MSQENLSSQDAAQGAAQEAPWELSAATAKHPCYSVNAAHQYARMHLPVAPACNIQCHYCNRKFDCVNESRPGVTREILNPEAARDKFIQVKRALPNLSVVGIAGPGDALANWEQTRRTLALIREEDPECLFCLSTNGLMVPQYGPELVALGVSHVTVTLNCIDPEIGAAIYHFVDFRGKRHTGVAAAEILLENQIEGIRYLVGKSVCVKVNIVMIPGINAAHIPLVVKKAKELGVFMTNIIPLIPAQGSRFQAMAPPSPEELKSLREISRKDIQQMCHCRQCRADAIGLLERDIACRFADVSKKGPATVRRENNFQPSDPGVA